jgi:hypothetical protein
MFARMLTFLTVITLVGMPAPARSADKSKEVTPTIIVRVDSINNLIEDVKYLGELAGQKDKVEEVLGFVKTTVESQKIDKAIDFTRPMGMYGTINPDNPVDSSGVILVPVVDEKALLDLLGNFQLTPEKGDDDVYKVEAPFPPIPIYFRFANKYAYITAQNKAGVAKESILDPGKVLSAGKSATFSAAFRFDQIPDGLKQMAVSQLEENLAKEKEKEIKGETKVQTEIRRKMIDGAAKHLSHLIQDAAELGLSFNIDRKAGRLTGEMTFAGKAGTVLAKEIANLGKSESLFSGLTSSQGAINVLFHPIIPEDVRQAIGPAVDEGFKGALEKEKDATKRELAEKIFKAIEPSLKSGELDLAFSFRGPSKENHYTFLAAVKLKEGEKVEEALKDLAKMAPEHDRTKIHFDAEKSGDYKIHKLDVQGEFDEKARAILGKHPIYVTFRSDAMLISGGARGLETIKEGLVAEPKPAPAGLFEISMSHLAPLILRQAKGGDDKMDAAEMKKHLQEIFKGDNDKIRATLEGGKALKGSFEMSSSVVTFIGKMATHMEGEPHKALEGPIGIQEKKPKKKPKEDQEKKDEDK